MNERELSGFNQVNAHEVAKLAGVSQSAVSRAFTPGASISPSTRDRVLKAARTLGYRPNLIARSLILRRSNVIGVAVGYLENQFNPQALQTLSRELQMAGYHVLLFTPDQDGTVDIGIEKVLQFQVAGLVLCSTSMSSDIARECSNAGVPVVMFNRVTNDGIASSVTGDNINGARTIGEFLLAGGHRTFAYMAGLEHTSTSRDREYGFSNLLTTNGFGTPLRVVGHYEFEAAKIATRTVCSQNPRPEALFCANDHMALAAIEVCRSEFGLRTPEDISIVGFDDVGPAQWSSFALTTYSQPVELMAIETARLLVDSIQRESSSPRQLIVQGELVVRGSARLPQVGIEQSRGRTVWRPTRR